MLRVPVLVWERYVERTFPYITKIRGSFVAGERTGASVRCGTGGSTTRRENRSAYPRSGPTGEPRHESAPDGSDAAEPGHAAARDAVLLDAIELLLQARKEQVSAGRKSEATFGFYREKAGHWLRLLGEDFALAQLSATDVDRYITHRRSEWSVPPRDLLLDSEGKRWPRAEVALAGKSNRDLIQGCIEYMDDFEKCGTSPPGEKQAPPELLALVAACDRERVRRAPSAALSDFSGIPAARLLGEERP